MAYDPPVKVFIPTPSRMPPGRGDDATSHRGGNLRIRCTDTEYDCAMIEARELGLSLAGFSRWCVVEVSKALRKHRDEQSDDYSTGE